MPQTHYTLGESIGRALGGQLDDSAYNKGYQQGGVIRQRNELGDKYHAEADAQRRQNELQSDDGIISSALLSSGIAADELPQFKNYMKYGKVNAPAPAPEISMDTVGKLLSPSGQSPQPNNYSDLLEQKPIRPEIDISPEKKKNYDLALRGMASIRQALALGDKSTVNAAKTALANLQASGAGTKDSTIAQLLLGGHPQYGAQANGVIDNATGDFTLNDYGASQIAENESKIIENKAQAGKAATTGAPKRTAMEANAQLLVDTGKAVNLSDAIDKLNGRSVKTDGLGNIVLVDRYSGDITSVSGNGKQKTIVQGSGNKAAIDKQGMGNTPVENAKTAPDVRFSSDPAMKGYKLGKAVQGKGVEVFDANGKLIGHYK